MKPKQVCVTSQPVVGRLGSPPASLVSLMFREAINRHQAEETAQAEALYRAILALSPDSAEAAYNLGVLLHARKQFASAIVAYRQATSVRPDYAEAYCNLGVALQEEQKFDDAIAAYQHAIALHPNFAMAHCNLGVTLKAVNRLDDAVASYHRAIAIKPDYDFAFANLAAALIDQGKAAEAAVAARRSIAIQPAMVMGHFNLGMSLKYLCELDEAAKAFRRTIELAPDLAEAHFTLGQTLLMQGDLPAGWLEYEWRWRLKEYAWLSNIHGAFSQPRWAGEPLQGRTILIYAEQGMGDTIQYIRLITRVIEAGGKVILAVQPPLRRLFSHISGVLLVNLDTVPLPPFDFHCPLLSLPLVFGMTLESIPSTVPYLQADAAMVSHWRNRLNASSRNGLRVGVVWAGNPTQGGDRFRSPRLGAVQALFDVPGVNFFALQVGPGRQDLATHSLPSHVQDLGSDIKDFADTAAIMAGLDLVITSCTAPLHLACALGVPTWAMIPASPHFAWLMNRPDSVWYPTLRLYRQGAFGSAWSDVVARIADDLTAIAERTRGRDEIRGRANRLEYEGGIPARVIG